MSEDLLLLLDGVFIAHLIACARRLPDRVASHFRPNGDADFWVRRRTYLALLAAVGPGLSLIYLGLPYYFHNPALHALMEHVAWAGCLLLTFIFGVHWLTVRANRSADPKLSMPLFWCFFAALQIGLLAWVITWPK